MIVPLCTSTGVVAAQHWHGWTILKASNTSLSLLRGQTLDCAADRRPLEGMSAGTALIGHNAVTMATMSGTNKQLTQAEHRPAEKQHMRHRSAYICHFNICLVQAKYGCLVMLKHLFLSRIIHSLHNASFLTPDTRQSQSSTWSRQLSVMQNEATGPALLELHVGCATVLLRMFHVPEQMLVSLLLHLHKAWISYRPAMGVLHSTGSMMTASAALIMYAAATPYCTTACWPECTTLMTWCRWQTSFGEHVWQSAYPFQCPLCTGASS